MRPRAPLGVWAVLLAASALTAQEEGGHIWSFDRDPPGRLPPRFIAPEGWAIAADASAPTRPQVLAAEAPPATNSFGSVCRIEKFELGTGQLWARLNVQAGAAGVVFRLRATNSFDCLTITPDGSRLQLLAVRDGAPQELAACTLRTTFGRWHRIGVELDGRNIACLFDGEVRLSAQDDLVSFGKGGVGLIVTPGGRAQFDDVNIEFAGQPETTLRAEPARPAEVVIEVLLNGARIYFGKNIVTLNQLMEHLAKGFDRSQRLLLLLDKDVDYERFEQVMKAAGTVGFEKISIELRK
ncbi:MAG: hypothetical protein N2689_07355 [Verrucomicrobiae bacterium]|nr:hypothetical protein [Verrucomicrobiae bacterium]